LCDKLNKFQLKGIATMPFKDAEKSRQYQSQWRANNPDKAKANAQSYYNKNKEKKAEYAKKYYTENKLDLNSKHVERKRMLRKELLEIMGGKCVKCGFSDFRALQIDHVSGGGTEERGQMYLEKYYNKIRKDIESGSVEYQLLCANCNWIKKYDNGEHAHWRVQRADDQARN
jgi:hypothetical protein